MPSADTALCPPRGGRRLVRTVLTVVAYCATTLVLYAPDVLRF